MESGEEIQETLRQFAQEVNLKGAFYQGIGLLVNVELAFFLSEERQFIRKLFDDEYELISLTGNLSLSDDCYEPHTHVCLSDRTFNTISGHLVRATVSVTAELFISPLDIALTRKEDPILNFKRLSLPNCSHLKVHF